MQIKLKTALNVFLEVSGFYDNSFILREIPFGTPLVLSTANIKSLIKPPRSVHFATCDLTGVIYHVIFQINQSDRHVWESRSSGYSLSDVPTLTCWEERIENTPKTPCTLYCTRGSFNYVRFCSANIYPILVWRLPSWIDYFQENVLNICNVSPIIIDVTK